MYKRGGRVSANMVHGGHLDKEFKINIRVPVTCPVPGQTSLIP